MLIVTLVVVVAALGFVFMKGASGGPEIQGTDSMPPSVRKAFMGAHQGGPTPQPKR